MTTEISTVCQHCVACGCGEWERKEQDGTRETKGEKREEQHKLVVTTMLGCCCCSLHSKMSTVECVAADCAPVAQQPSHTWCVPNDVLRHSALGTQCESRQMSCHPTTTSLGWLTSSLGDHPWRCPYDC